VPAWFAGLPALEVSPAPLAPSVPAAPPVVPPARFSSNSRSCDGSGLVAHAAITSPMSAKNGFRDPEKKLRRSICIRT
jgi:hypothetical protein